MHPFEKILSNVCPSEKIAYENQHKRKTVKGVEVTQVI
jgi:hypothetical protein